MPKYPTFPYLFDEKKSISIIRLKQWKYLKEGSYENGTITWSIDGIETSSIGVIVDMCRHEVTVYYKCNGNAYNYNIQMESLPSNLGKGKVWYFICPYTGKRSRKLHFINERFMHRSALPSGMYSTQTHSKKWRQIEKVYGCYFDSDKLYDQLYKKRFKKTYRGKPTKRYLRIMEQLKKTENISSFDIEQLMLS